LTENHKPETQIAIEVEDVSMKFNLSQEKVDNLKEYIIRLLKRDIGLFYQEFWALKKISFKVEKGDKFGIIGLNGAGKSTLLKLISGIMKPTEGNVKVKGKIAPLLELGAGFDSNYTGRENIFLYGSLLTHKTGFLEDKFDEIVEFSELEEFIDVPVKNYSSGMKARLGFSIATIVEPEILILDEVLSVGDAKFQEKSKKRMNSLLNKDVTVLMVSHSINQIKEICNNAIWIDKGKLIMQGTAEEVCDAYWEYTQNNTKEFNKPKVVNNLNLQLNEGEILSLLGFNNVVKNNSVDPIIGLLQSTNGKILFNDNEIKELSKKKIGICPKTLNLWNNLTCRENLNLMGEMYKVPKKALKLRVEKLLYDLFLTYDADTIVSKVPIGMKRRLNLALALVHDPDIIIIDEPFNGSDHQSHTIIWNYIQSLRDHDGKTVILITQHADEADNISDRVAIIDNGQILRLDTPFNLKLDIGGVDLVDMRLSNQSKNREVIENLRNIQYISSVDEVDGYIHMKMLDAKVKIPLLMKNIPIEDLSVHQNTLDDVFTELTGFNLGESK
jgi:ABC-2 type transport system ATP-binding protein